MTGWSVFVRALPAPVKCPARDFAGVSQIGRRHAVRRASLVSANIHSPAV